MKSKKRLSVVFAIILSFMFIMVGCGKVISTIDPNKKLILFSVYDGGYGTQWISDMMDEYNKTSKEFVFAYEGGQKKTPQDAMREVESGTRYDVYYTGSSAVQAGIYNGLFEDLSDVYNLKVDGENGGTIKDKMLYKDSLLPSYSKNGEGAYIIPLASSVNYGLVYDHTFFAENGFLNKATASNKADIESQGITVTLKSEELIFVSSIKEVNYNVGDVILTAGKDGKYGTYDDGQATNVAEFDTMLAKMLVKGIKPFCYSGIFNGATEQIVMDHIVQNEGIDTLSALLTFDSKGKNIELTDGTQSPVTIENANQVIKKSKALYNGVKFVNDYLYKAEYKHPGASGDTSHLDAQNSFLMGFLNIQGNPQSAFLLDGSWWENEARRTISDIAKQGNPNKAYGKVDYRYYLLPNFDAQKGYDGKGGKGTPISCNLGDGFYVPKTKNAKRLAAIKDFLGYTLKEENLRLFTKLTGVSRPFEYEITTEDKKDMSKFAKNVYSMLSDTQNIQMFASSSYVNATPFHLASSLSLINFNFPTFIDEREYTQVVQPLRDGKTVDEAMSGVFNYSDADWAKSLQKLKENGFYK